LALNCSAIPEDLLEAELFGHEKGAFTGADKKRIGHFGMADGGSLFLDEIGDMPLRLQAKLLRVLQERKFTPIGGTEGRRVDIRIIAATNIDLAQAVKTQKFRLDLYYRLNVLPIDVPPLRERRQDIPLLLEYFLQLGNRAKLAASPCWIAESVGAALAAYSWPGNIRQLQNLIERLLIIKGGGWIELEDLPLEYLQNPAIAKAKPKPLMPRTMSPSIPLPDEGIDLCKYIGDLENQLIIEALAKTQNNKNQAAKLLGLNRTTLVERIKKRNIKLS
jgi:transcriptional regulator with PAS, ATPase and Fis domain